MNTKKTTEKELSFWGHLEEMRNFSILSLSAFILSFILCFFFKDSLFSYVESFLPLEANLFFLSPFEAFFLSFRLCFYAALILCLPLFFSCLSAFVFPALQTKEKKVFWILIALSFSVLIFSLYLSIVFLIPLFFDILLDFSLGIGQNLWSYSSFVSSLLWISFGSLCLFQIFSLSFTLVHFRILPFSFLQGKRSIVCLLSFIIGAFLSPPDPFTQCLFAIPLYCFYECLLLYSRYRIKSDCR